MLLAADKMNVTLVFLKSSPRIEAVEVVVEAGNLVDRRSDIVVGTLPLLPLFVSTWFQPTIPYEYTAAKWFVPCPKPVARMEKVMQTYTLPVWLTMATVLLLTAILLWGLSNWRHSALKNSRTFQTLSHCLYNTWVVGMGVSATNTPKSWKFRLIFLVYVWYCFAMSTVFQAFFISYLVEPGYGKKFETFDDLLHSHLAYTYSDPLEASLSSTSYDEYLRFPTSRRQDCNDLVECTRRIANNDQLFIMSAPRISQYIASEMGIPDSSKYICTLEENLFTNGFAFVLNNGSPFLNRLNVLTRRSLEGGLLDRYWAQLLWIKNLRSKMRLGDGEEAMYFVFSLSHLSPAFCVLGFGCVLSSVVFLAEIFVKWIAKDRTVKWSEVRKELHSELIIAPLLTHLNIQNRISATETCANFQE